MTDAEIWLLASVPAACVLAAASGRRFLMLAAVVYGIVVLGRFFSMAAP